MGNGVDDGGAIRSHLAALSDAKDLDAARLRKPDEVMCDGLAILETGRRQDENLGVLAGDDQQTAGNSQNPADTL